MSERIGPSKMYFQEARRAVSAEKKKEEAEQEPEQSRRKNQMETVQEQIMELEKDQELPSLNARERQAIETALLSKREEQAQLKEDFVQARRAARKLSGERREQTKAEIERNLEQRVTDTESLIAFTETLMSDTRDYAVGSRVAEFSKLLTQTAWGTGGFEKRLASLYANNPDELPSQLRQHVEKAVEQWKKTQADAQLEASSIRGAALEVYGRDVRKEWQDKDVKTFVKDWAASGATDLDIRDAESIAFLLRDTTFGSAVANPEQVRAGLAVVLGSEKMSGERHSGDLTRRVFTWRVVTEPRLRSLADKSNNKEGWRSLFEITRYYGDKPKVFAEMIDRHFSKLTSPERDELKTTLAENRHLIDSRDNTDRGNTWHTREQELFEFSQETEFWMRDAAERVKETNEILFDAERLKTGYGKRVQAEVQGAYEKKLQAEVPWMDKAIQTIGGFSTNFEALREERDLLAETFLEKGRIRSVETIDPKAAGKAVKDLREVAERMKRTRAGLADQTKGMDSRMTPIERSDVQDRLAREFWDTVEERKLWSVEQRIKWLQGTINDKREPRHDQKGFSSVDERLSKQLETTRDLLEQLRRSGKEEADSAVRKFLPSSKIQETRGEIKQLLERVSAFQKEGHGQEIDGWIQSLHMSVREERKRIQEDAKDFSSRARELEKKANALEKERDLLKKKTLVLGKTGKMNQLQSRIETLQRESEEIREKSEAMNKRDSALYDLESLTTRS